MPRKSRHTALLHDAWPERDRLAYALALTPGDILGPGGPAGRWSPAMQAWATQNYGQWLGWLERRGQLDASEAPDQRVTRGRVSNYIQDIGQDLAPSTVASRVRALWRMTDVMVPDPTCIFLKEVLQRLPTSPSPGPRTVGTHDLLDLGLRLMVEAQEGGVKAKAAALAYRNGLMIALLSLVPLRRRNFAGLELGQSILQVDGTWRIQFAGGETKTKRRIDMPLPGMLCEPLEHYISHHRIRLAPSGVVVPRNSGALWLSSTTGAPLAGHTINQTIGPITEEQLGERINLHKFRKAAPTTLAIHAPEKIALGTAVLGHTSQATTGTWYNMADGIRAAERLQTALADIKKEVRS
jgi:integrase